MATLVQEPATVTWSQKGPSFFSAVFPGVALVGVYARGQLSHFPVLHSSAQSCAFEPLTSWRCAVSERAKSGSKFEIVSKFQKFEI